MKTYIFTVIIVLVFATAYYFYYKNQKDKEKQDLEKKEEERKEKESESEIERELQKREELKEIKKKELKKNLILQKRRETRKKQEQEQEKIKKQKEDLVYMDIGINNKHIGRIIIKLFSDVVPKTCNNFRTLCNNNKKLSYKRSPFHRIIKDFMIQGGDFTNENGKGGMSIYGSKFEDENFDIPHDQPYLLSMANSGPNTNGSQFFITTSETPHLDGKHVVFGIVVEGHEIVDELNNTETDRSDRPTKNIRIMDCGKI
jgi:cyclophilin family peptidyl-prolyl cis-trans isomerase